MPIRFRLTEDSAIWQPDGHHDEEYQVISLSIRPYNSWLDESRAWQFLFFERTTFPQPLLFPCSSFFVISSQWIIPTHCAVARSTFLDESNEWKTNKCSLHRRNPLVAQHWRLWLVQLGITNVVECLSLVHYYWGAGSPLGSSRGGPTKTSPAAIRRITVAVTCHWCEMWWTLFSLWSK